MVCRTEVALGGGPDLDESSVLWRLVVKRMKPLVEMKGRTGRKQDPGAEDKWPHPQLFTSIRTITPKRGIPTSGIHKATQSAHSFLHGTFVSHSSKPRCVKGKMVEQTGVPR